MSKLESNYAALAELVQFNLQLGEDIVRIVTDYRTCVQEIMNTSLSVSDSAADLYRVAQERGINTIEGLNSIIDGIYNDTDGWSGEDWTPEVVWLFDSYGESAD